MPSSFEGRLPAADNDAFAIVVSRFNDFVTHRLLEGALAAFREHGVAAERITTVWVPGAFEIPLAADRLAKSGKFAAVCCLGAVIQGETSHHESINREVSRGVMQAGLESGVPVIFGVLACQSIEHAMDRAGGKFGNKGSDAARAAIEMVDLIKKLQAAGIWNRTDL
jgi:6,7-dimethyl-8-ribityllumazine synthase